MEFLEDESQSLDRRYRPRTDRGEQSIWIVQDESIGRILERCRQFNDADPESAALEEEQERQLSPEIEEEREVEKPAPARALKHSLHKDLVTLIATGNIAKQSQALVTAFQTLLNSTAAKYLKDSKFLDNLFTTVDSSRTVHLVGIKYVSDSYYRPV